MQSPGQAPIKNALIKDATALLLIDDMHCSLMTYIARFPQSSKSTLTILSFDAPLYHMLNSCLICRSQMQAAQRLLLVRRQFLPSEEYLNRSIKSQGP